MLLLDVLLLQTYLINFDIAISSQKREHTSQNNKDKILLGILQGIFKKKHLATIYQ